MHNKIGAILAVTLVGVLLPSWGWYAPLQAQERKPAAGGQGLLKGIKAAPGFQVTLFAAPPDVRYPTCLAAAPTGEVFVGIDENGSLDQKPDRGRVVRCVD